MTARSKRRERIANQLHKYADRVDYGPASWSNDAVEYVTTRAAKRIEALEHKLAEANEIAAGAIAITQEHALRCGRLTVERDAALAKLEEIGALPW